MRRTALFLIALLGASCAHRVQIPLAPSAPAPTPKFSKQVLAFYYGWYGRERPDRPWVHWSGVDEAAKRIASSTNFPELGAYDSHDPAIVERHCRWASAAGITGFIVSWWRPGDFHDQGLPLILDTAARFGLRITIYFEQVRPSDAPSAERAVDDLAYVLERYGRHPAWLTVGRKPVVFVYARAIGQLPMAEWPSVLARVNERYRGGAVFIADRITSEAARTFDGVHTYNPTGATAHKSVDEIRAWARTTFPRWIAIAGPDRIATVTILAGYDDSTQNRQLPRPITHRHDGATYRALWEEALAVNPDWILICSWNEWHEGSEIEPSAENRDRELRTTAEFAVRFLASPTRDRLTHRDSRGLPDPGCAPARASPAGEYRGPAFTAQTPPRTSPRVLSPECQPAR